MRQQLGKDKILSAAVRLFARKGYHPTSISQIAEAARVSKGLTYNYFKSKEELLLAIVDQATEDIYDVADAMSAQGAYQDTLGGFLDRYIGSLKANRNHLSFHLSLFFQPDLKEIVKRPLQNRADRLLALTEAMFRGAGIEDANLIARRFIAELDGIALHYLAVFKDYPLDRMRNQLFDNYKDLAR